MSVKCIDVSTHQGDIDWTKVKKAGVTHAVLRVGYRTTVDAKFNRNYKRAKKAGIKIGGYWYSYAYSKSAAIKEANACLNIIKGKTFDMPIYYDIEEKQHWSMGKTALTNMIDAFCSKIKKQMKSAGIYSSESRYNTSIDYTKLKKKYSIWIAAWRDEAPSKKCDIWQYTASAKVNGISGNVDGDKILGDFKGNYIATSGGPSDSSDSNDNNGVVEDPNDVINADAIDALLISLTTKVTKTDYKKLLKDHVSGVILKAGSYFTSDHKVSKYYRNPNLQKQIDQAVKAGVRFGLYVDVRAKTLAEAKLECEQLYYVISKYPPALGLWLHLMFTASKKTNHKILDYYLDELKRWGLTKGCGIYCTKNELKKIDWKKYQDDLFLWYVKRFSKDSELAELKKVLTPDFFKR